MLQSQNRGVSRGRFGIDSFIERGHMGILFLPSGFPSLGPGESWPTYTDLPEGHPEVLNLQWIWQGRINCLQVGRFLKFTERCTLRPRSRPRSFPSHSSSPTGRNLLNSKGPHETCNRGSNGQGSLSQANPLNLSSRLPFLWLSSEPKQPCLGSLLLLLLY